MVTRKISLFSICNAVILLLIVAATFYPFVYMLSVSLSGNIYVMKNEVALWPKGFNVEVYKFIMNNRDIWISYRNTIVYTVLGTSISLLVTSMGAYALSRKEMALNKTFTMMVVITMFFGGGMIPTFLVVKSLQIMDTIWAMVLPGAVSTWNLILMRTFFSALPKELEESGRLDGLTDLGLFFRVVIPLSNAVFATIGLFYAVGLWNNFMLPLLYLRDPGLFPLQVILRNIVLAGSATDLSQFDADNLVMGDAVKFATIIVSAVPILMVYPFLQKYFVQGATVGAVKG